MRTTLPAVNKVLKARGHAERLVRGDGYFHFVLGESNTWFSTIVLWLNDTPERIADLRDELAKERW